MIRGLSGPMFHEEFTGAKRSQCFLALCKKAASFSWAATPQYGHCFSNSITILHEHPDYQICLGKMGWKDGNGEVFWEFG